MYAWHTGIIFNEHNVIKREVIIYKFSLCLNPTAKQVPKLFLKDLSNDFNFIGGHSITRLTTFCTSLTTYLPLLTIVDIPATTYLMSTLTLTEVPPIIFNRNIHLISNSILWINVLNFVNISKWHTLIMSTKEIE